MSIGMYKLCNYSFIRLTEKFEVRSRVNTKMLQANQIAEISQVLLQRVLDCLDCSSKEFLRRSGCNSTMPEQIVSKNKSTEHTQMEGFTGSKATYNCKGYKKVLT